MGLAEGIRKIGFRRWYERQLIQSHLYLVSTLLCVFTVLAAAEGFNSRDISFELLIGLLLMVAGSAAGIWTFVRYARMMVAAQYAADRSVCARCKAYGVLEATGAPARTGVSDIEIVPTPVRCRECGNEWTIE